MEELGGGNSSPEPMGTPGHGDFGSAYHPNISDKVMYLQMAFKQRPLRDGGGKPSFGRLAQSSSAGGQDLCPHFAVGTSSSRGGTPSQGASGPKGGIVKPPPTWGLALAGAGHQVGAAQGGRHQDPPESEGFRKDWRFQVASLGGKNG